MKNRLWLVSVTIDNITTIVTVLAPTVAAIHDYFGKRNALVWEDFDAPSFAEPDFDVTRPLGLPTCPEDAVLLADSNGLAAAA